MKNFFTTYGGVLVLAVFYALFLAIQLAPADVFALPLTNSGPTPVGSVKLVNPLGVNSFCGLVIKLLQAVIVIGIPIAVLFIVWAGFKFVLAQGNGEALKSARQNFLHVVIGIGIFVGSTLIANVIVNTLVQLGVKGVSSCG
jgi:hypothetical protein